jgi:hypothetical protein
MHRNDSIEQLIRTVRGSRGASSGSMPGHQTTAVIARLGHSGGTTVGASGPGADAVLQNTSELAQLRASFQAQIDAIAANTKALSATSTNTVRASSSGSSAGGIGKAVLNAITGGFALTPIVSGLLSLFGGGDQPAAPAPLTRFQLPPSLQVEAGVSATGGTSVIDYGQNGLPRGGTSQAPSTQVTVQVNAMDSQSFLDRSADIASAVRRAMLESSSLNDVVQEL